MDIQREMNSLELKGEDGTLSEEELKRRKDLQEEFWKVNNFNESLLRQKGFYEVEYGGDCNTRFFFHNVVNRRRKKTMLRGVNIKGAWLDDPIRVKEEAKKFFELRFREDQRWRYRLDGVPFNQISKEDNSFLLANFGELDIKEVVWDYGNLKCPGLDELNFKFIKQFWYFFKDDVKRFLDEFHQHGRLLRGTNVSFISLIPKIDEPQ